LDGAWNNANDDINKEIETKLKQVDDKLKVYKKDLCKAAIKKGNEF